MVMEGVGEKTWLSVEGCAYVPSLGKERKKKENKYHFVLFINIIKKKPSKWY